MPGTLAALLLLGLSLAGCASTQPVGDVAAVPVETAAPIDPNDRLAPYVPHIREASARFDVPEPWIRAVIHRESRGRHYVDGGRVISSPAGAIGIMQVMPGTYALMRDAYGLGPDVRDARDNILAGTAYIREMYDLFGAPGFLAAYNCGPACYANHLAGKQRLPGETRAYLASVAPVVRGHEPREPSAAAGAVAIEVAVLPKDAPRPAPSAAPARKPEPVAPSSSIVARAKPAAKEQPVQVAAVMPVKKSREAAPVLRYQVAEALAPAGVDADRVQIRFVTQRSDGCGSMKGRDSVCVSLDANSSRF